LAEHAGEARPDGMQRLLSQAVWESDGVRDDLRSYILEQLGEEAAILVIDETSFPKRGQHSAGVGLQYCGTTGQVENCQVGVFLSYVTPRGHSLIDRELYLPLDWCEDRDRCRAASIPESVRFQTKPELARAMIERIWKEKIPISWVVAGIGLRWQSGPAYLVGSAWVSLRDGCGEAPNRSDSRHRPDGDAKRLRWSERSSFTMGIGSTCQ